jgi:hypothetical protein
MARSARGIDDRFGLSRQQQVDLRQRISRILNDALLSATDTFSLVFDEDDADKSTVGKNIAQTRDRIMKMLDEDSKTTTIRSLLFQDVPLSDQSIKQIKKIINDESQQMSKILYDTPAIDERAKARRMREMMEAEPASASASSSAPAPAPAPEPETDMDILMRAIYGRDGDAIDFSSVKRRQQRPE